MTIVNSAELSHIPVLRRHPWFEGATEEGLAELARRSRWIRFDAGETLFSEGQAATACLLVCAGVVQGLRYTVDGDDKVFGHVQAGGWLSLLTLFESQPRHLHTVRVREPGEGCLFDAQAMRRFCHTHPRFACRALAHGASLIHHHTDQIDRLTSSGAEERVAEYILRAGKPQNRQPVVLPLSHSQIAVKLGMRPETLSRIFAKWRREGYISQGRGEMYVLKIDSLRRLAPGAGFNR